MEEEARQPMQARPYQLELADYVTKRNGIIYLPTGAGKTFVAILVLKRYAHTLQESIENGGKRAIFMCNTVELSRQQASELKKTTCLKVGLYIGDRDVDNWSRRKWEDEIKENQVLVGTAQIFLDIVSQNLLKINQLSLVIIDECHHSTGAHPMHSFLSLFRLAEQSQLPRVIGLTGVLIKGNKFANLTNDLRSLEVTLRGNIITVRSMEQMENVMVFSTKPVERLVSFGTNTHKFRVENEVLKLIEECKKIVDHWDVEFTVKLTKNLQALREPSKKKSIKNLLSDFVHQMAEFGLYAGAIAIMSPIIEFEIKKRQAETVRQRDLYRVVIQYCERIRHLLVKELKSFIDTDNDVAGIEPKIHDRDIHQMDIILNYSTPKLRALFQNLEINFKGKARDDIACLVFVERRHTAKCLYHVLLHYVRLSANLKDVIRPQFMVGRDNIIASYDSILDAKWNKKAIEEFRIKQCNLIVCSNVLEEGIDVQACNYVFAFDPLKTFNSYIQSKGRARCQESYFFVFTPVTDEIKTLSQIKNYQMVHEKIKEFLMTRILERNDPNEEEIAEQFVDLIPPYIISSGAKLLATAALSLLHRYCQSLPWDAFGACQPWYNVLPPKNGKVAIELQLPLQSTVRETITSNYMNSNREAKVSAAFKACIRLYENGELNKFLLPVTKTECIAKVEESLFKHWKKYDDNVCKKLAGKQMRRLYERKCPEELYESLPKVGETAYAYTIQYSTEFGSFNSYNEHIVNMLNSKATYGILLSKKLPKLAQMPLFMSQGKLHVKIAETPIQCVLKSEQELSLLKQFHVMIFRDILDTWKEFTVLDHRNKENSFLIVPIRNTQNCIDWEIVKNFQRLSTVRKPTVAERRDRKYRPSDYLHKIVTKWYTEVKSEQYVVTRIREDLSPKSSFASESYGTYSDFFTSRYNVEICNKSQFLVEVKALTQRRNFFNNANNKTAVKRRENDVIVLIPELVHNFNYPSDLWMKALILPSILHRMYYALHAEMLRNKINKFLRIDKYLAEYSPQPLIIDSSLKRVLDDDGNLVKEKNITSKYLPPLPTKDQSKDYHIRSLDSKDVLWKRYMEPLDRNRNFDKMFPVEVQYYVDFINDPRNVMSATEEDWTKSQLEIAQPTADKEIVQNVSASVRALAIKDSPRHDKIVIEILQRSVEKDQKLKSAEQFEFLAALTTAGVNDVFDMERYEILGDAFLKFSVSLYLANKYTDWNEGFLTIIKGRIVSNRNLLYCLMESDISKRICSTAFKPNFSWLPPLCSLPENLLDILQKNVRATSMLKPTDFYDLKLSDEEIYNGKCSPDKLGTFIQKCTKYNERSMGSAADINLENDMYIYMYKEVIRDKIVADTLEAILGVCVKNYGLHRSFRMLEFFNLCPSEEKSQLNNLLDLKLSSSQLRTNISRREINGFIPNAHLLEKNIGYQFKDRAFLLQALTHPSYPTNRLTGCYQELEFIGDAILDMLMTCFIFERFQHMDPGKITDLRSALVNNITLGCICVRRKIHLFMLYENVALSESIKTFAEFQDSQHHRVTDQVRVLMEEGSIEMSKTFRVKESIEGESEKYPDDYEDMATEDDSNISFSLPSGTKPYNIAQKIDVPKALGDVVEAIIGAIYLDCRDLSKTWEILYSLFEYELNEFSSNIPIDPVRQLGEVKHANAKYAIPLVDNEVCMVQCNFNCLDKACTSLGFGSNAVQAKKAAAKQALKILLNNAN